MAVVNVLATWNPEREDETSSAHPYDVINVLARFPTKRNCVEDEKLPFQFEAQQRSTILRNEDVVVATRLVHWRYNLGTTGNL